MPKSGVFHVLAPQHLRPGEKLAPDISIIAGSSLAAFLNCKMRHIVCSQTFIFACKTYLLTRSQNHAGANSPLIGALRLSNVLLTLLLESKGIWATRAASCSARLLAMALSRFSAA